MTRHRPSHIFTREEDKHNKTSYKQENPTGHSQDRQNKEIPESEKIYYNIINKQ